MKKKEAIKKMKWSKQEEDHIDNYMEDGLEELNYLIDNPQEIETGCPINCDRCLDYESKLIKEAYRRKKLNK